MGDMENSVVVSDYQQMDRILKEERNYIIGLIKKIKASGCNVLLIQKSILRDAVTDLSLHYLAKAKILVVRDVERDDVEFISKTLRCQPVAHVDQLTPDKLGSAELVASVQCGADKMVKITGIENMGNTVSVLCPGRTSWSSRRPTARCTTRCASFGAWCRSGSSSWAAARPRWRRRSGSGSGRARSRAWTRCASRRSRTRWR